MSELATRASVLVHGLVDGGPERIELAGGNVLWSTARSPDKATPNEDALLILELGPHAALLAVADGCGGMPQGELASRTALVTLRDALVDPPADGGWAARVFEAFERAGAAVAALGGPATTLSAVLLENGLARSYHAGDSPILIFGQRGRRKLEVVAHSPTAYAVEAGFLIEQDALVHESRHVVLNALGTPAGARIEIGAPLRLAPHDTVLVASDGLSDNLYSGETIDLLRAGPLARGLGAVASRCRERMSRAAADLPGHADDLSLLAFRLDGRRRAV